MRVIHIGDIHLYRLRLAPWHMASKRILGQTNLWLNRRKRILRHQAAPLVQRVLEVNPDLILFSGDLTVTALHKEFLDARRELQPLLDQHTCVMTPGNHDRYSYASTRTRRFERYFSDWTETQWPGLRRLSDNLVLITLDPTRPNRLNASGLLGREQRERLKAQLKTITPNDRLLMLCHYDLGDPPGYKAHKTGHGLIDKEPFLNALPKQNPILYMHGHVHHPWLWHPSHMPNLSILNAGAALMTDHGWLSGQGFWEIEVNENSETAYPWQYTHHSMNLAGLWSTQQIQHSDAAPAISPRYI